MNGKIASYVNDTGDIEPNICDGCIINNNTCITSKMF